MKKERYIQFQEGKNFPGCLFLHEQSWKINWGWYLKLDAMDLTLHNAKEGFHIPLYATDIVLPEKSIIVW